MRPDTSGANDFLPLAANNDLRLDHSARTDNSVRPPCFSCFLAIETIGFFRGCVTENDRWCVRMIAPATTPALLSRLTSGGPHSASRGAKGLLARFAFDSAIADRAKHWRVDGPSSRGDFRLHAEYFRSAPGSNASNILPSSLTRLWLCFLLRDSAHECTAAYSGKPWRAAAPAWILGPQQNMRRRPLVTPLGSNYDVARNLLQHLATHDRPCRSKCVLVIVLVKQGDRTAGEVFGGTFADRPRNPLVGRLH